MSDLFYLDHEFDHAALHSHLERQVDAIHHFVLINVGFGRVRAFESLAIFIGAQQQASLRIEVPFLRTALRRDGCYDVCVMALN